MSRINQAFALIAASMAASAQPIRRDAAPAADGAKPPADFGSRPLNKSEIDDIVRAIGNTSPVVATLRMLSWFVPMAIAVVAAVGVGRGFPRPTQSELMWCGILFLLGLGVLVRQKWLGPR